MIHTADSLYYAANLSEQYGLKAGLRKFADCGNATVVKEITQFYTLKCFKPCNPSTLSKIDRRNVLMLLMFLTEKWGANGSAQHTHIAKEEATVPTVTSNAIFIQCPIFAHKGHDIITCNIPGTFLQVDNPDYILMRLNGILAELMVKAALSMYRKYATTNAKGKPVLYVQLEKAVYGMMKSALLFYWKLVADLKSIGFEVNPYDPCVANKIINGKQMTICWHVDSLFQGHADPAVVTWLLTLS